MPHLRTYPSQTFVALPKYHRIASTKAPMNSCRWVVSIHLIWRWGCQYAPITLQRLVWYVPQSASDCFPSHISVTAFTVPIFQKPLYKPSFGLRARLRVTMIWYAPPIAYRLVANSLFYNFLRPRGSGSNHRPNGFYQQCLTTELNTLLTHRTH